MYIIIKNWLDERNTCLWVDRTVVGEEESKTQGGIG